MSGVKIGSLFADIPERSGAEHFEALLEKSGLRLERIVSHAHATPPGEWLCQDWPEWVVLLRGSAGLSIESQSRVLLLRPGDYVYLPAQVRHRVEWTDSQGETVWLALHHMP